MKIKSTCLLGLVFLCILSNAIGQDQELTLEKIYLENKFRIKSLGPVKWLKDGSGFTSLEASRIKHKKDIIKYIAETGKRTVLIHAASLVPEGEEVPLLVENYSFSNDGEKVLIFTNSKRVWRDNTRGDFWVFYLKTGKLQQLGKSLPPAKMQFAKFSPDSKKAGYVCERNIFIEDLSTGTIDKLTTDGGNDIINGTFDWVHEEELGLQDGFRWSPDSRKIAYWQMDTEGVGIFYMINNIDSIYPKLSSVPYPKVGTTNSASRIGIVDTESKKTEWLDITGDPRNHYLARMDWAHSSDEVIVQQLNRDQNTNKVYLGNAKTGNVKLIYTEKVDTWLDVYNDLTWLEEGKFFTWRSDKTGWLQLYKFSRDGKLTEPITKGDFEIIDLLLIDQKKGWVYYIAAPDNPTERYLYRNRINGEGKHQRLSPVDQKGHHSYKISPEGKYAIHTFSNSITPPQIDLVSLPDHKILRALEDNKQLKEDIANYNVQEKEFFKLKISENLVFDGWLMKPLNFDSSKKYPVIFYVYGEPFGSTVQNNYSRHLFNAFMVQQGYIVMSIDNRGTDVPRGREWRKCVYKKIGIIATDDQATAAKEIMKWDFIDKDRIGIWGWSGGGSMTLNCMFKYPEIYKTGIAVAFMSHQKLYNTIYQERYMGHPDNNIEGYKNGSPITHAKNLQGSLLLIHGSGDDNCHFQSFEMLVDELIKHNKYFTMFEYPMRSHGIYERENTSFHLHMTMYKYFKENLPAGGR